jgi:hypothetical protein
MLSNRGKLNYWLDWTLELPLYLDDEVLNSFLYPDVAIALLEIKRSTTDVAVTPAIARSLIRKYLLPLIPPENHHVLDKPRTETWDGIFGIYSALGCCVAQSNDRLLLEVMTAVQLIHRHTIRSTRELMFPFIEVTYFLNMCSHLKIAVQSDIRPSKDQRINVFSFCTLCWRQPLPGRKLCAHHAPSTPLMSEEMHQSGAAARYKAGVRQKDLFDATVNRILTKDVLEFHDRSLTPAVLFPEQRIAAWLSERRPSIWQLLGNQQQGFNDGNAVGILLDLLHSPDSLPFKTKQIYQQINWHLQEHPHLIWPMLVRAEGWYQCREELQGRWGGKRSGAGRPAQL